MRAGHSQCIMLFKRSTSDLLQLTVLKYSVGAGKAGYAGFMVTVDAPRLGNRIADERNKYVNDAMFSVQLTPAICTSPCARFHATLRTTAID